MRNQKLKLRNRDIEQQGLGRLLPSWVGGRKAWRDKEILSEGLGAGDGEGAGDCNLVMPVIDDGVLLAVVG